MVERLLEDPEDVLHFDDKTLISNYRLLRNMILQLAHVLQPQPALRPFQSHAASGGIAARLPLSLVEERLCAVEAVLASRSQCRCYHSYKQQITFVFPKLNK